MRLVLATPSAWSVRSVGSQQVATLVEREVVLAWGPLVPLPDDRAAWFERALHADVTETSRVDLGARDVRATTAGWKLALVDADVVLPDGTIVEHRVGAFYTFLEYGAVALVRARSRAALDDVLPDLARVLAGGTPAWQSGGSPSCLHDLWS